MPCKIGGEKKHAIQFNKAYLSFTTKKNFLLTLAFVSSQFKKMPGMNKKIRNEEASAKQLFEPSHSVATWSGLSRAVPTSTRSLPTAHIAGEDVAFFTALPSHDTLVMVGGEGCSSSARGGVDCPATRTMN